MQQKVQFATALIHEPELVILDEPWSGLDPINAEVLREVVDEIRAPGRTVLFSTHRWSRPRRSATHVCIIARGKKVLDGKLQATSSARRAAEGVIALGVRRRRVARTRPTRPLEDKALVVEQRPPRPGEHADCEVMLADGVDAAAAARGAAQPRTSACACSRSSCRRCTRSSSTKVGAEAAVAERREARMAGMRDTLVIARREFLERVQSKWFVVMTLLGPIFMVAHDRRCRRCSAASGTEGAKVEIVDQTGKLGAERSRRRFEAG